MDLLVNTLVITGMVVVVIFFIIAVSINTVSKQTDQSKIVSDSANPEE